jgi:hypothetical protein
MNSVLQIEDDIGLVSLSDKNSTLECLRGTPHYCECMYALRAGILLLTVSNVSFLDTA